MLNLKILAMLKTQSVLWTERKSHNQSNRFMKFSLTNKTKSIFFRRVCGTRIRVEMSSGRTRRDEGRRGGGGGGGGGGGRREERRGGGGGGRGRSDICPNLLVTNIKKFLYLKEKLLEKFFGSQLTRNEYSCPHIPLISKNGFNPTLRFFALFYSH